MSGAARTRTSKQPVDRRRAIDKLRDELAAPVQPSVEDRPLPNILPPDAITLDGEQEQAIQDILSAEGTVILTGQAGSGKSTVIKELFWRTQITLCATTARAALAIGGCTIDRLFCFSRDTWKVFNQATLDRNMAECADIIVIDEASMIGANMANLIEKLAKQYGKRLILVGDWAQASPVKDEWATATSLFMRAKFIKLTHSHRQADAAYLTALNRLRYGIIDYLVRGIFQPCLVDEAPADDRYIRLFATNNAADTYNQQRLGALGLGHQVKLQSTFTDMRLPTKQDAHPFDDEYIERQLEEGRLAHGENFRIGARVVLTMNDKNGRWVNGDTGVIKDIVLLDGTRVSELVYDAWKPVDLDSARISAIVVTVDRFAQDLCIQRGQQEMNSPTGEPIFVLRGFPLRLAWAITIHRSQGMTLDRVYVDMGTIMHMQGTSKHGLCYVAFSRTRTLEGLKIGNWNDSAIYCCEAVKPFI